MLKTTQTQPTAPRNREAQGCVIPPSGSPGGMTLKQLARKEFFEALEAYRKARENPTSDPPAFVLASVRLHAAKGGVPKSLWPLANRAVRGEK